MSEKPEMLVEGVLRSDRRYYELYHSSAWFRAAITAWADLMVPMLVGLADHAEQEGQKFEEKMRLVREAMPLPFLLTEEQVAQFRLGSEVEE